MTLIGNNVSRSSVGIHIPSGGIVSGNNLANNKTGMRVVYNEKNPTTMSRNSYSKNTTTNLDVAGTINSIANWDDTKTVQVSGRITIAEESKLTIAQGTTVKLMGGTGAWGPGFNVYGTLLASGVKFTWADAKSEWSGIAFVGSGANKSQLRNCIIEHAGGITHWSHQYNLAAVYIEGASPLINKCTIRNSGALSGIYLFSNGGKAKPSILNSSISGFSSYGIAADTDYFFSNDTNLSSPTIKGNKITNNDYGIMTRGSGIYQNNTISGNSSYGLYKTGYSSRLMNATNNYWGDPTGPLDDSDDTAKGGLFNPNGLGDKISDGVNYSPWLISSP